MPQVHALRPFMRPPWPWLLAAAGLGFIASIGNVAPDGLPALCSNTPPLLGPGLADLVMLALLMASPGRLVADWALMLLAMMPPLLAMPLIHVWRSSLPRRRLRASGFFMLGYAAVWMMIGPALIAVSMVLQFSGGAVAAWLVAGVWSASPWHRIALNRTHRLRRIGLFGWSADRDALSFGLRHAGWCVASCWPWMLVPLVAGQWHVEAMIVAAAVIWTERLGLPGRPRWRLPAIVALLQRLAVPAIRMERTSHG